MDILQISGILVYIMQIFTGDMRLVICAIPAHSAKLSRKKYVFSRKNLLFMLDKPINMCYNNLLWRVNVSAAVPDLLKGMIFNGKSNRRRFMGRRGQGQDHGHDGSGPCYLEIVK